MPVVLAVYSNLAAPGAHAVHPHWCAKWPWCGEVNGRIAHSHKGVVVRDDVVVSLGQVDGEPPTVTVQVGQQYVTLTADEAFDVGWVVRWTAREALGRRRSWG